MLRALEPLFPKRVRRRAIDRAVAWTTERLNGLDGLGAIFPAMANSVMMYDVLGYPKEDPNRSIARASIDKLLVIKADEAYCQPCVSPVWDTGLTCHTLLEVGDEQAVAQARKGLEWLQPLQVLDVKGDWAEARPNVRPGGWAFQYANAHYPDLDDTAVVVMAMDRVRMGTGTRQFDGAIDRAREWVEGLQSKGGGWAAFDADNTYYYLNNIPFADHGALLDPPTEDVAARCLSMLAQLGETSQTNPAVAAAIDYLRRTQLSDGSWYGRWGMNYIYGTWSALCALNAAGVDHSCARDSQGRRLAGRDPESGRGLGRRRHELQARLSRLRACAQHGLANGMGRAGANGRRGSRQSAVYSGALTIWQKRNSPTDCGVKSILPLPDFRVCFICVIMGTESSFRYGRWRGTGT